jgi:molybdopterin synthase sulfur carrier subunit
MQVTVKLFAQFRKGRFIEQQREYAPHTLIAGVLEELGIGEPEIGFVMMNSRRAELTSELEEGARLAIFPLVGGG